MPQGQSKSSSLTADAVIVGGGIHGCSTALHLALRGLSAIVLEKDHVGRHASGVNAGGVRRLGRALPEVPLSVASAELWQEIEALVDDDCRFEATRQIKVAETPEELRQQEARVAQLADLGYTHERLVDSETLRELLPAVAPHCLGGIVVDGDGQANPFRAVRAFMRKARALGVRFKEGCAVTAIERDRGVWRLRTSDGLVEAPRLVNCAGAWGGKIAEMLGEAVPLEARAPMLMITARMPLFLDAVVGTEGRTLSFKQFANGTVLIGGGHEGKAFPDSNRTQLDYRGLATSARTTLAIFPLMATARVVRCWAGIEGFLPDGIPVIGPSRAEGAFHGFGFSAHGFQLGPIGGRILSELVVEGATRLPIAPFRIDRFQAAS